MKTLYYAKIIADYQRHKEEWHTCMWPRPKNLQFFVRPIGNCCLTSFHHKEHLAFFSFMKKSQELLHPATTGYPTTETVQFQCKFWNYM